MFARPFVAANRLPDETDYGYDPFQTARRPVVYASAAPVFSYYKLTQTRIDTLTNGLLMIVSGHKHWSNGASAVTQQTLISQLEQLSRTIDAKFKYMTALAAYKELYDSKIQRESSGLMAGIRSMLSRSAQSGAQSVAANLTAQYQHVEAAFANFVQWGSGITAQLKTDVDRFFSEQPVEREFDAVRFKTVLDSIEVALGAHCNAAATLVQYQTADPSLNSAALKRRAQEQVRHRFGWRLFGSNYGFNDADLQNIPEPIFAAYQQSALDVAQFSADDVEASAHLSILMRTRKLTPEVVANFDDDTKHRIQQATRLYYYGSTPTPDPGSPVPATATVNYTRTSSTITPNKQFVYDMERCYIIERSGGTPLTQKQIAAVFQKPLAVYTASTSLSSTTTASVTKSGSQWIALANKISEIDITGLASAPGVAPSAPIKMFIVTLVRIPLDRTAPEYEQDAADGRMMYATLHTLNTTKPHGANEWFPYSDTSGSSLERYQRKRDILLAGSSAMNATWVERLMAFVYNITLTSVAAVHILCAAMRTVIAPLRWIVTTAPAFWRNTAQVILFIMYVTYMFDLSTPVISDILYTVGNGLASLEALTPLISAYKSVVDIICAHPMLNGTLWLAVAFIMYKIVSLIYPGDTNATSQQLQQQKEQLQQQQMRVQELQLQVQMKQLQQQLYQQQQPQPEQIQLLQLQQQQQATGNASKRKQQTQFEADIEAAGGGVNTTGALSTIIFVLVIPLIGLTVSCTSMDWQQLFKGSKDTDAAATTTTTTTTNNSSLSDGGVLKFLYRKFTDRK
jgi:hypothetical protein